MATEIVDSTQAPPIDDTANVGSAEPDNADPDQTSDAASDACARGHASSSVSVERLALWVSTLTVVTLAALAGWLGYRAHQVDRAAAERTAFIEAARQAAVNLTTIDFEHADADVQRILDSATGAFHDDFQGRSQPFIDVVKKARSKSEGTVTMAGLESADGDNARILVAMSVNTTTAAAPQADPRAWRMRIDVEKAGSEMKISNVEFVP